MPTPRTEATSLENPRYSVLSLLRSVWKRRYLSLSVMVLLSSITFGVVLSLPAIYRSEAHILVDSQKIPEQYVASTVNSDVGDRLATISQQILSSTRLKKIIDDFDLYREDRKKIPQEEIIEKMRSDIDIQLERGWTGGRPGAFRVAYQGPNPTIVAEVANRLANLYIEENLRTRYNQAEGTSDFIEAQLKDAQKKLDETEAAVSKFKTEHAGELPQEESQLTGALGRLQVQLQGNQDALNRDTQSKVFAENALAMAQAAEAAVKKVAETPPAAPVPAGSPNPTRRPLKASELMERQLDVMQIRYGDAHPDVKRLKANIDYAKKLERQLDEKDAAQASDAREAEAAHPPPSEPGQPQNSAAAATDAPPPSPELIRARQQVTNIEIQLNMINKDLDVRAAERQQILKGIATDEARVARLPIREQEMAKIMRDYEISKVTYSSLLAKKNAAEMSTDMERREKAERFTMLDPGRVPERPFKPNRPLWEAFGSAFALALGLAVGIGRELQADVLLGEWELQKQYPILGRVSRIEEFAIGVDSEPKANRRLRLKTRKVRLLISSAVLSLLAVAGACILLVLHRL
jgi:succinoglycan biosynthesis transport protein ExoP